METLQRMKEVKSMEEFFHVRLLNLVTMSMVLAFEMVWHVGVCKGEGRTAVVTGMVFCDQCSLGSLSALSHPLAGAEVSLHCKQGLATAAFLAATDENGIFSVSVEEEDAFEFHGTGRRCTVQLARSNDMHCHVPTDIESGVSGATISIDGGVYIERALYYVGPLAYRVNHPPEACDGLKMKSAKRGIGLQRSLLPVRSLRASLSRGLKTVDTTPTIPSSAARMPSTAFSRTKPPSYNLPVTRPTPIDDSPSPVKPPEVPTRRNPSPTKCLPIPQIPHYSELTKLGLHYPLCKTPSPQRRGAITPPSTPDISPPIRSGAPKDKSPSYGGFPTGKLQPPPPPPKGFKLTHPSPPPTLSPSPTRHPIHRPSPYHRPSPLPHQRTPSPSRYRSPLPPSASLRPSPPPQDPPSNMNAPPYHHKTFPSPSPPPQPPSLPLPPHHPPPPTQYHKPSPLVLHTSPPPKHPTFPPQRPSVPKPPSPAQYHKPSLDNST